MNPHTRPVFAENLQVGDRLYLGGAILNPIVKTTHVRDHFDGKMQQINVGTPGEPGYHLFLARDTTYPVVCVSVDTACTQAGVDPQAFRQVLRLAGLTTTPERA